MRRPLEVHQNHERWLVSYADFITLLFAFFVVMFASTQTDHHRAKEVSDSVRDALEQGQFSHTISMVLGRGRHMSGRAPVLKAAPNSQEGGHTPAGTPGLEQSLNSLRTELSQESSSGKVALKLTSRGLVISLRETAFFASGNDDLAAGGLPILAKIAAVIGRLPNPVRFEGHTDSVPIHNSRFRSNWDLSAARAIAMMQVMSQRFGIPEARLAIAGYADTAPADSNDTDEGRAHNRRVDIVVMTHEGARGEPDTAPAPQDKPRPW